MSIYGGMQKGVRPVLFVSSFFFLLRLKSQKSRPVHLYNGNLALGSGQCFSKESVA